MWLQMMFTFFHMHIDVCSKSDAAAVGKFPRPQSTAYDETDYADGGPAVSTGIKIEKAREDWKRWEVGTHLVDPGCDMDTEYAG